MANSKSKGPQRPKRVNKKASNEIRALVISALNSGRSFSEIPDLYNVNVSTARKMYKVFQDEGRLQKLPKGGNHRGILTDEQKKALCNILDEDCLLTTQKICDIFFERYSIRISRSTASRSIREFHYSFKTLGQIQDTRNDSLHIEIRKEYAIDFLRFEPERKKIIFIDKMDFQVNMLSRTPAASKGAQAKRTATGRRSRNYSVSCAMSCEGLINFRVEDRHHDAESFQKYLLNILEILRVNQIEEAYIVMNNLQIQKAGNILIKIREFKHMTICLPSFSPFLNPVENLFAKWKELVRDSNSRTAAELFSTIETCSASITGTDCSGFYRNMKSYLRDCIKGRPIEN